MAHLTCTTHKQRVKVLPPQRVVHTATGDPCRTKTVRYRQAVLTPEDVLDGSTRFRNTDPPPDTTAATLLGDIFSG